MMTESYNIIYCGGKGEIIERKSRFIGNIFSVHTEMEAEEHLIRIRKEYRDATHHCFAYILGEKNELQRCSDDGEPSGTAGRPILDVLIGEGLHNVLAVVTRYFGGTLLGTGGLVRAYQRAAQEGLKNSVISEHCLGKVVQISMNYSDVGKIQHIIGKMELTTIRSDFMEAVTMVVLVPLEKQTLLEKQITEITAGKIKLELIREVSYVLIEGNSVILD